VGGTGTLVIDENGQATINYTLAPGVTLTDQVKAYIGTQPVTTTAPGQMPITVTSNSYKVTNPNPVPNNFYFYIHFGVEFDDPNCGGW